MNIFWREKKNLFFLACLKILWLRSSLNLPFPRICIAGSINVAFLYLISMSHVWCPLLLKRKSSLASRLKNIPLKILIPIDNFCLYSFAAFIKYKLHNTVEYPDNSKCSGYQVKRKYWFKVNSKRFEFELLGFQCASLSALKWR